MKTIFAMIGMLGLGMIVGLPYFGWWRSSQNDGAMARDISGLQAVASALETNILAEREVLGIAIDETILADLQPLNPDRDHAPMKPYGLWLVFKEVSCNTCLKDQVARLRDLAALDPVQLEFRGLVYSTTPKYLSRFKRVHRLKFPFYSASDALTSRLCGHGPGPAVVLVDYQMGRVIAVHLPSPDRTWASDAFFQGLHRMFGNQPYAQASNP